MSHAGHETVVCSCGARISSCRCIEGGKSMRVVEAGCTGCKALALMKGHAEKRYFPEGDRGPGYTER